MQWAFEAVCVKLQLAMGSEDRVTELVGDKIIELATAGERNPDRLTARVLAEFGIENDGSLWPALEQVSVGSINGRAGDAVSAFASGGCRRLRPWRRWAISPASRASKEDREWRGQIV
jgi:hypothetical protein